MRFSEPATIGGDAKGDSPTHHQQLPRLQQRLDDLQHQRGDLSPLARPFLRVDVLENNNDEAHSDDGNDARQRATPLQPDHSVERLLSLPEPELASAAGVALPARSPSWSETSSSVSNPSPREGDAASGEAVGAKRKRPRFLGDIDRRMIIQRLENGEKQADLAREFGVTRAAICHINKNREEILTRFDILAKSPQGRQMIENYVRSPHFSSCVRELRTPSVAVLLTRLRDAGLSLATFKSTADRLMTMLLEEALVGFGTKAVGVEDLVGANFEGKEYARAAFALALGERGRPLLNAFAVMEPAAFRGFVHVDHAEATDATKASSALVLRRLDLPEDAAEANVLVCQVALDTAQRTGFVVEALVARGVAPSRICVVCVTAAADAVSAFASRFRDVKLVTAAINADMDAPRLAGFVDKYQRAASL